MKQFVRHLYSSMFVLGYYLCALGLLCFVFRISGDSGGPSATFYWGASTLHVVPTAYYGSWSVRLQFLYPYLLAAAVITALGCGVTRQLVRLVHPRRSRLFVTSFSIGLSSMVFACVVSDVGTVLHFWRGPAMFSSFGSVFSILEVAVPLSVLAAFLIFARFSSRSQVRC
jgi:hypothetical protein